MVCRGDRETLKNKACFLFGLFYVYVERVRVVRERKRFQSVVDGARMQAVKEGSGRRGDVREATLLL